MYQTTVTTECWAASLVYAKNGQQFYLQQLILSDPKWLQSVIKRKGMLLSGNLFCVLQASCYVWKESQMQTRANAENVVYFRQKLVTR